MQKSESPAVKVLKTPTCNDRTLSTPANEGHELQSSIILDSVARSYDPGTLASSVAPPSRQPRLLKVLLQQYACTPDRLERRALAGDTRLRCYFSSRRSTPVLRIQRRSGALAGRPAAITSAITAAMARYACAPAAHVHGHGHVHGHAASRRRRGGRHEDPLVNASPRRGAGAPRVGRGADAIRIRGAARSWRSPRRTP